MFTLAVAATGTAVTLLAVLRISLETQVLSVVDRSVTLCNPGATPVNVAEAWNAPPSRLYSYAPVGAVMTMVPVGIRSEEHTSELQSLTNVVCRLLLEKKRVALETQVLSVVDR